MRVSPNTLEEQAAFCVRLNWRKQMPPRSSFESRRLGNTVRCHIRGKIIMDGKNTIIESCSSLAGLELSAFVLNSISNSHTLPSMSVCRYFLFLFFLPFV